MRILRCIPEENSPSNTCLLSTEMSGSGAGMYCISTTLSGVERREWLRDVLSYSSSGRVGCGGGVLYGWFMLRDFFLVAERLLANQALTALGSLDMK